MVNGGSEVRDGADLMDEEDRPGRLESEAEEEVGDGEDLDRRVGC
jgi:hypothetical protein